MKKPKVVATPAEWSYLHSAFHEEERKRLGLTPHEYARQCFDWPEGENGGALIHKKGGPSMYAMRATVAVAP